MPPWPQTEKLAYEKELLGFYVTGHPLDDYRCELESGTYRAISSLGEPDDKVTVRVAGALTSVEKKFTKKDAKPFAICVLEDLTGTVETSWSGTRLFKNTLGFWSKAAPSRSPHGWTNGRKLRGLSRQEIRALKQSAPRAAEENGNGYHANGHNEDVRSKTPVLLRFPHAETTEQDLLDLKEMLAATFRVHAPWRSSL